MKIQGATALARTAHRPLPPAPVARPPPSCYLSLDISQLVAPRRDAERRASRRRRPPRARRARVRGTRSGRVDDADAGRGAGRAAHLLDEAVDLSLRSRRVCRRGRAVARGNREGGRAAGEGRVRVPVLGPSEDQKESKRGAPSSSTSTPARRPRSGPAHDTRAPPPPSSSSSSCRSDPTTSAPSCILLSVMLMRVPLRSTIGSPSSSATTSSVLGAMP